MNIPLLDVPIAYTGIDIRTAKITAILENSCSKNITYNRGLEAGMNSLKNWSVFLLMSEYEFENLLELLVELNSSNLFITLNDLSKDQEDFFKLLLLYSVFRSYIKRDFMVALRENVHVGKIRFHDLFEAVFRNYSVSNDFNKLEAYQNTEGIHAFFRIRNGATIRTLNPTKFPISKKASFYFHNQNDLLSVTGDNYIEQRIIASLFAVLDSEKTHLIDLYLNSCKLFKENLTAFHEDIAFWKQGFDLLYLGIEDYDIRNLVDFLESRRNFMQGDFNLKGRTYRSVFTSMNKWHIELTGEKIKKNFVYWKNAEEEGTLKKLFLRGKIFEYKEIIDSYELFLESKGKQHCVYSYLEECKLGKLSIWVLRPENTDTSHGVTIEVKSNTITQVLGKHNLPMNELDRSFLKEMSIREGLDLGKFT
jgi:hypothetical protein